MDEEKLDISIIQHFASGVGLDKKKKRKLLSLFKYLAGGESPIEAVELTVRRDHNLREAQLKMGVWKIRKSGNGTGTGTGTNE